MAKQVRSKPEAEERYGSDSAGVASGYISTDRAPESSMWTVSAPLSCKPCTTPMTKDGKIARKCRRRRARLHTRIEMAPVNTERVAVAN